jgi:hypothetical protein
LAKIEEIIKRKEGQLVEVKERKLDKASLRRS